MKIKLGVSFLLGFLVGVFVFYNFWLDNADKDKFEITLSHTSKDCSTNQEGDEREPAAVRNELELVEPPKILVDDSRFQANQFGEIYVKWEGVKEAAKYVVTVTDVNGKVIRSINTGKRSIYFRDLTTGKGEDETHYFVSVASLNKRGLVGKPSQQEKLTMYPVKNLTAPKIKTIVTED